MKLQIELKEDLNIEAQLLTIAKYIEHYSTTYKEEGFLGMWNYRYNVKETDKDSGVKVETEQYTPFHISCQKTKGGIVKFKIWNG